jgi:hypothetical protein
MFLSRWFEARWRRKHPMRTREQIRDDILARYEAIGRGIAMRMTRGNGAIIAGNFATEKDRERRRRA